MQNRTLKGIQEIEQLFKIASKYDLDYQTREAKLIHIQEKLIHLKKINDEQSFKQKKELKARDKQIQNLRQKQRNLLSKLSQNKRVGSPFSQKIPIKLLKNSAAIRLIPTISKQKRKIEKQKQKKNKAQQRLRQLKSKLEKLQEQLLRLQKQNSALKSENQRLVQQNFNQKLMIQAFLKEEQISQRLSESQSQIDSEQRGQINEQINNFLPKNKDFKMMDLESQGILRINQAQRQEVKKDQQYYFLKYDQQRQTDDQQEERGQDQDQNEDNEVAQYVQYQSDNQDQSQKTLVKSINEAKKEEETKVKLEENNKTINHINLQLKKQGWFSWLFQW